MWSLIRNPNYWRNIFPGVLMLGTTGVVQGTVTDVDGLTPVVGAIVRICPSGPGTITDESGSFRMAGLPIGTYHIVAYNGEQTAQDSEDIDIETNSTTTILFTLQTTTSIGCP